MDRSYRRIGKMKQAIIPKFSNEVEEADWWDAHRSEIESEIQERLKQGLFQKVSSSKPEPESFKKQ